MEKLDFLQKMRCFHLKSHGKSAFYNPTYFMAHRYESKPLTCSDLRCTLHLGSDDLLTYELKFFDMIIFLFGTNNFIKTGSVIFGYF